MKLKVLAAALGAALLASFPFANGTVLAAQTGTRITAPDVNYKNYTPGTFNVQIPERFLPAPVEIWIEVPADYDERVGRVVPGTAAREAAAKEKRERQAAQHGSASASHAPNGLSGANGKAGNDIVPAPAPRPAAPAEKAAPQTEASSLPKTKKIRQLTRALNPYRMPAWNDFTTIRNVPGKYTLRSPLAFGQENPLAGLPVNGPMTIRSASNVLMLAVTVDDPTDTKYYKPQNNFPALKGAVNLFRERRPATNNRVVTVNYRQGLIGGVDCIEVLSDYKAGERTFRTLWIFPERQKYELLAQALYAIETLQFAD